MDRHLKAARLLYISHEFWHHRAANQNGTTVWRCVKSSKHCCKAFLITKENTVVGELPSHNHEGNSSISLARKAIGEMKKEMDHLGVTASTAISAISNTFWYFWNKQHIFLG